MTARPLAGAEHAQQLLDMLRAKGASPGPTVRPRDAAPVLARAPLERDRAFVAARAPEPMALEPDGGRR